MPTGRAIVRFPYDTNVGEDVAVNTWHFFNPVSIDNFGPDIVGLLDQFYTDVPAGAGAALEAHYSSVIAPTASVTCYDLNDPAPRVPFYEATFNISPPAVQTPLPSEIAVCFSFQADPTSGVPQARRRGRVFIGPLNADALTLTSGVARVDPDLADILRRCGKRLINNAAASGVTWGVFSEVANAFFGVTNGWIDNAFDVQRRRGEATTVRDLFTATIPA